MGEAIRTRKGKLAGEGKHNARLGRVVQVKKKGRRISALLSSAGKKSSLTMIKRNRKRRRTKRLGAKTSRAERSIHVMVEARQHQNGGE